MEPDAPAAPARPPIVIRDTGCTWGCGTILAVFLGLLVASGAGLFLWLRPVAWASSEASTSPVGERLEEVEVVAEVASASWVHHVAVERLDLVERVGFRDEIPKGAVDVRPLGPRVRSVERVQRGWTTETYTEEVPDGVRTRTVQETVDDGYDTRRVTERVRCGEDCEPGQETCREVCRPNGNGFATCRQQCTRGRERCEPRYCNETRTERTPRQRTVTRTVQEPVTKTVEKTRRVPAWEDVPRQAPAFAWKQRDWVFNRVEDVQGEGFVVTEPVLARGVKERLAGRSGTYTVVFREVSSATPGGPRTWTWEVPSAGDLRELQPGQTVVLRLRGEQLLGFERRG